jgi:hypothetical protein
MIANLADAFEGFVDAVAVISDTLNVPVIPDSEIPYVHDDASWQGSVKRSLMVDNDGSLCRTIMYKVPFDGTILDPLQENIKSTYTFNSVDGPWIWYDINHLSNEGLGIVYRYMNHTLSVLTTLPSPPVFRTLVCPTAQRLDIRGYVPGAENVLALEMTVSFERGLPITMFDPAKYSGCEFSVCQE